MTAPMVVVSTSLHAVDWVGRCLDSVASQTVKVPHVYVTDGEDTLRAGRFHAKRRGYPLACVRPGNGVGVLDNLFTAVAQLPPETIVVWLDGDDRLCRDDALEIVARAYEDPDVWMTFGQFRWDTGKTGFAAEYPPEVIADNAYRCAPWLATILRTFRAGLFQQLTESDLKRPDGTWNEHACDQCVMLPLLELAGGRHRFIPEVLAEYYAGNLRAMPWSQKLAESQEVRRIRLMPPKQRLGERPW